MGKTCAWCGEKITNEENCSHEDREFFNCGKLALYYCDDECRLNYLLDEQAHNWQGLYYVARRANP